MTVGEKIYTLRMKAGYSQEEFAEVIGVSRQSVSKWETSSVMPDTEYIVQICKVLAISTDTLLLDNDAPIEAVTAQNKQMQQSNDEERACYNQQVGTANMCELSNVFAIAGFVLSFLFSILGLIVSSLAVGRERHSSKINHLAVSGVAISCVKIYATIVFAAVYSTLYAAHGGVL